MISSYLCQEHANWISQDEVIQEECDLWPVPIDKSSVTKINKKSLQFENSAVLRLINKKFFSLKLQALEVDNFSLTRLTSVK